MISSINSTVSALQAYVKQLGVTANNIANVNTEGYKKYQAVLEEGPFGDVQLEVNRVDSPGYPLRRYEDGQWSEKQMSNTQLTEEIPDLMIAQRAYEANLKTVKTQDHMLGSLLDIVM
jgi:flagellar hook protein FlgE